MPHYDKRGAQILELSGAQYIAISPIVEGDSASRSAWETWSVENQWIPETYRPEGVPQNASLTNPEIFSFGADGLPAPLVSEPGQLLYPAWQVYPVIPSIVNLDILSIFPAVASSLLEDVATGGGTFFSPQVGVGQDANPEIPQTWPITAMFAPIFDDFDGKGKLSAILVLIVPWHRFFQNILPEGTKELLLVVRSTCGPSITYQVQGPNVAYVGAGDLHDPDFEHLEVIGSFDGDDEASAYGVGDCFFTFSIYPTVEYYESLHTKNPFFFTFVVVFVFVLTSMVFVVYDCFVQDRQNKVLMSAQQSNAIVSSLFPAEVRDRLMGDNDTDNPLHAVSTAHGEDHISNLLTTRPIADLFPSTTVMFGDISGFTAWASVREPSQVFTLLEQIYNSFDAIAKRKGIFKVETIGDCYVAAAGLPKPRKDHAVAMARFADLCRHKMNSVVKKLEVLLGPDTADLTMRFGLHSGPVTAGVLRGEKSRFQLFGDTVNTAARMESTGTRDKIHISRATADLLTKANKMDWFQERENMVAAKGKGLMQTYWLTVNRSADSTSRSMSEEDDSTSNDAVDVESGDAVLPTDPRVIRLINWNVDVLQRQLKKITAMRDVASEQATRKTFEELKMQHPNGSTVLDEVKEVIPLCALAKNYKQNPDSIELTPQVMSQLRDYVSKIASMYQDNPFHNFEHASHVTQSVTKLLARIVTLESIDYDEQCYKKDGETDLHKYTYGITSDPLIQFACAFSALIHDVDHTGFPNAQLVKENSEIAKMYKNKSVAEQNSVDIAWELLMEPAYVDLRNCIYQSQKELDRFRHLIVNAVMATDIADREQAAFRKKRWEKAFSGDDASGSLSESSEEAVNRKATIVIEHLIQASDVAHTMQHWHVYLKWNKRLFQESYKAYLDGHAEKDPSENWYKGEMGFYDFYIIPLAKKLKDCGVFGVASDEYLDYATANRMEWELKGESIVQEYLMLYQKDESGLELGLAGKGSPS
jgi:class 3 adenylate cyclase